MTSGTTITTQSRTPLFAMALIAGCMVALQVALMRVASITLWYHFAFMMISLSLLGGGIGSAVIYRWRDWWSANAPRLEVISTLGLIISLVVVPPAYLNADLGITVSLEGALNLLITVTLFLIPFTFGGFIIASLISRYTVDISKLYFADLGGAALGSLATVGLLFLLPAPVILVALGVLPLLALLQLLTHTDNSRKLKQYTMITSAFWIVGVALSFSTDLYRIHYTKTRVQPPVLWESWNPYARITVLPQEAVIEHGGFAFGWSLSSTWQPKKLKQLWIEQDASAGTPITPFDASADEPFKRLDHLGIDVTAIGYNIFRPKTVCIIGPGGGRDILTALYFNAEHITAIELNPATVYAVDTVFGDFTGHIYSHEKVSTHVDEARGFLTRDSASYDLLQISMIDSWAAAVAGAFSLAENNLYTVEAFSLFLERLTDDGILSISRWYMGTTQAEAIRLVSLCYQSLKYSGVENPMDHLVIIRNRKVITALVKKSAFTDEELAQIWSRSSFLLFKPLYTPGDYLLSPTALLDFCDNIDDETYLNNNFEFDWVASTDDRPFFFQMRRGLQFSPTETHKDDWKAGTVGIFSLSVLLVILTGLASLFVIGPLLTHPKSELTPKEFWRKYQKPLWYFVGIGLGFLTIEISLIQRYVLYLGHPIYAVTVVIFSLLLGGAFGSLSQQKLCGTNPSRKTHVTVLLVIIVLSIMQMLLAPLLLSATQGIAWILRAGITTALVGSLGVALGLGFPLAVSRMRSETGVDGIAWLWGVNTVCSVLASIVAIFVAIQYGYTASLSLGIAAYVLCLLIARLPWGAIETENSD
ncbi:hypothetical protein JYT16_02085 [Gemmatimonas aurantiaca]|nr:hypothetical protein [Gemmatimonas aurantiaca]